MIRMTCREDSAERAPTDDPFGVIQPEVVGLQLMRHTLPRSSGCGGRMCRGPAAGPEALVRLACPLRPSRAVLHLRPGDPRMAINDECKADICNASLDTRAVRIELEARVLMFRRRNLS